MSNQDSRYLIEQLLNNKLSGAELDDFLAGLHDESRLQVYSESLERYFNELLSQHEPPPKPGNWVDEH